MQLMVLWRGGFGQIFTGQLERAGFEGCGNLICVQRPRVKASLLDFTLQIGAPTTGVTAAKQDMTFVRGKSMQLLTLRNVGSPIGNTVSIKRNSVVSSINNCYVNEP